MWNRWLQCVERHALPARAIFELRAACLQNALALLTFTLRSANAYFKGAASKMFWLPPGMADECIQATQSLTEAGFACVRSMWDVSNEGVAYSALKERDWKLFRRRLQLLVHLFLQAVTEGPA